MAIKRKKTTKKPKRKTKVKVMSKLVKRKSKKNMKILLEANLLNQNQENILIT